jgi:uncharacterized membrane protein
MTGWLLAIFGLVCAQDPAHSWAPGGVLLPCCQRCTGVYVGAFVALALHVGLRIKSRGWFLPVHGLFLLAMIPLGFHWIPQNDIVRSVSGSLYGAGLVAFLWLHTGGLVTRPAPLSAGRAALYAVVVGAGAAAVPALGRFGGVAGAWLLAWLALAGLLGLTLLALANVGLAVRWLVGQAGAAWRVANPANVPDPLAESATRLGRRRP